MRIRSALAHGRKVATLPSGCDNSRAYWSDHRALHDDDVRAPMLALLADLEPEFGAGKVFRPHRDGRFSADKSPFTTQCGATSGSGGYVQVSAEGLLVASGMYAMAPAQVARYRAAVEVSVSARSWRPWWPGCAGGDTVDGNRLRTRSRGTSPEHPRLDLLRHRSLHAWRSFPPDDALHTRAVLDRVRSTWRRLGPLARWLDEHVGHLPDD